MYHRLIPIGNQSRTTFLFSQVLPRRVNRRPLWGHPTFSIGKPLSGSSRNRLSVAGKPPPAKAMAGTVVVFDFDRTILDGDSDNWVVTEMGLAQLFSELRSTMTWNSLMVCANSCFFFSLFLLEVKNLCTLFPFHSFNVKEESIQRKLCKVVVIAVRIVHVKDLKVLYFSFFFLPFYFLFSFGLIGA